MKSAFVAGSGAALAAMATLDTTVAFLMDRRHTTALTPTGRESSGLAYVWRRVFLKGRARRS